jgi:predicted AAA+ superfamily ATPase
VGSNWPAPAATLRLWPATLRPLDSAGSQATWDQSPNGIFLRWPTSAIGRESQRLAAGDLAGPFLESYVLAEITKQVTLLDEPRALAHFRDRSGVEVDIIIERPDGAVTAVEVTSATSTNQADTRGLRFLRDRLGDRFQVGLLLHTGPLSAQLGDRIWAAPVSTLWGGDQA